MQLRNVLAFLRIMKIPGLFGIMKDWQSLVRTHFLYAAVDSGLLPALATPASREDLIQKMKVLRPDLMDALLDVGLAAKELAFDQGKYRLKGKRSIALAGKDGDMLSALIQANFSYYHAAFDKVANRLQGGLLGDDLEKIGTLVARFSKIGDPLIRNFLSSLVRNRKSLYVLDVGCGSGIHLQSLYQSNRQSTGIGIDIDPTVAEQARKNISDWGLSEKFRILTGDVRLPIDGLEGPFDLITLLNILYYFPLPERLDLLRHLGSRLTPDGFLAIAMNCHGRGKDLGAANLNLVNCSLKGLTPLPDTEEIMALLKEAGFNRVDCRKLIPGSSFYGFVAGKV